MICIIAMVVFGLMSIFSARYRPLAREAFDCVFRRITFRPCNTGFDVKMKSMITGKVMKRSKRLASFIHTYFELLSWAFILIFFVSIVGVAYGGYNFYLYGNCNGPQQGNETPGFCIFDPTGSHQASQVSTCGIDTSNTPLPLIPPKNISEAKVFGDTNSKVTVVMFGCFSCDFTRQSSDAFLKVYAQYKNKVNFVYIDYPLTAHPLSMEGSEIGTCIYNKNKDDFFPFMKDVFHSDNIYVYTNDYTNVPSDYAQRLANLKDLSSKYLSSDEFDKCLNDSTIKNSVEQEIKEGKNSRIYGTPTFFINNESMVGPRPKAAFVNVIDAELEKTGESSHWYEFWK